MNNNQIYRTALESFSMSIENLSKSLISSLNINDFNKSLNLSLLEFSKSLKKIYLPLQNLDDFTKQLKVSMEQIVKSFDFEYISIYQFNNTNVTKETLEQLQMEIIDESYVESNDNKHITNDEINEMQDDIINIFKTELSDEILQECKKKWHEKHPIIFQVILTIIGAIVSVFVTQITESIISNAKIKRDCNIYMDSSNKSQVICNISENTTVTIIDKSPNYYYKIIYTNIDTNKDIEGYITKLNIELK